MIRINPQWSARWAKAHPRVTEEEMLERCVLLGREFDSRSVKTRHYWDRHGDLCVETLESNVKKITDYIRKNLIATGICGENGKIIRKNKRR